MAPSENRCLISSKEITKYMTLYINGPFESEVDKKTLELKKPTGNPLVLMLTWFMAEEKHFMKYVEIYTYLGFDVIAVRITLLLVIVPAMGSQVVAADTLKFLENNKSYAPIVVHGFSAGAYQMGEIILQMSRDMDRYSPILNRIVCQIWDSAFDITEVLVGLPKVLFPKNQLLQNAFRIYLRYHLQIFYYPATVHYIRSSQIFYNNPLKKPALILFANNDPIAPSAHNYARCDTWERAGINVTAKCWDESVHVGHMLKYREEYLDVLLKHLKDAGVFNHRS